MGRSRGSKNVEIVLGQKFGRLTVLSVLPSTDRKRRVLCRCDCGIEKVVSFPDMRVGHIRSCGCLIVDTRDMSAAIAASTTHGQAAHGQQTKTYKTWIYMRRRCSDPAVIGYENYGGRGIKVCDRWQNSFENFASDVGTCPSPEHSIDRLDVNGQYEPGNCRWATKKEQAQTRRNRITVNVDGQEVCLKEACEKLGMHYRSVWSRIKQYGWSVNEALNTPFRKKGQSASE